MAELIELLDLERIADRRFDHFSAGEKQRMAIARGLLAKPKILLMDEPTKGVDPVGAAQMVRILKERIVAQWRPTILITSHNLTEIELLCSHVALMNRGRIVAAGDLDELRDLAGAARSYRMSVSGLMDESIHAIARQSQAREPIELTRNPGIADLSVSYANGDQGFSRMVRAIVESGGDLVACTAVQPSFDVVFHSLLEKYGQADSNGESRASA